MPKSYGALAVAVKHAQKNARAALIVAWIALIGAAIAVWKVS